jgi:hypothetical protein
MRAPPLHASGSHRFRPNAGKVYRGSRRRLRRIKWRENMSVELWIFVAFVVFLLIFGIPWLVEHPPRHQHQPLTHGLETSGEHTP